VPDLRAALVVLNVQVVDREGIEVRDTLVRVTVGAGYEGR